ncbi:hypothetical protein BDW62DRAFT_218736 [Aspergillus aurantiobrunneus]
MLTSLELGPGGSFLSYFVKSLTSARTPPSSTGVDLTGQTAIITGGYTGLGYACAEILLKSNLSHLIITVRNETKGKEAAAKLQSVNPTTKIEVWLLDMLSYDSVQTFVQHCNKLDRIDFIILNAGVVSGQFTLNETTKHEETFQVNYLSTALLTILLLPVLKSKRTVDKPSRITIVGSGLAVSAKFAERKAHSVIAAFDNPEYWAMTDRYSTTKLLLLPFISELAHYVDSSDVVVNVADPGFASNAGLDRNAPFVVKVVNGLMRALIARTVEAAAWTYVDAAVVKPITTHGSWIANWVVYPFPKVLYTPEGKRAGDKLWEETLAELEWANVRGILSPIGKGSD